MCGTEAGTDIDCVAPPPAEAAAAFKRGGERGNTTTEINGIQTWQETTEYRHGKNAQSAIADDHRDNYKQTFLHISATTQCKVCRQRASADDAVAEETMQNKTTNQPTQSSLAHTTTTGHLSPLMTHTPHTTNQHPALQSDQFLLPGPFSSQAVLAFAQHP